MQSAFMNPQQYAGSLAQQPAVGYPMPQQSLPQAGQFAAYGNNGFTQLPNVPQPPYLRQNAMPAPQGGNGGVSSSIPDLPTPDQLTSDNPAMNTTTYVIPGVFGNGGGRPANNLPTPCQAVPALCNDQAQAYRTASSFPVNALDPSADVPSPYMVAPWLYLAKPQTPPAPTTPYPQPQQQPAQSPQAKMPMQPPQQQQPQQPPQPPPQQQPPQPPPPQPPQQQQAKGPTTDLSDGGLSDSVIRSLNDRLNSDGEDTRADAAMELFKILDKDPTLSTREPYKRYVNAFMEKIMKDPSAVVRAAGELALQTGRVQQPSEGIMGQLKELDKNPGGLSGEGGIVSGLLNSIQNNTLGSGYDQKPGAMTTMGGSEAEAKKEMPGGQNPAAGGNAPPGGANGQPGNPAQAQSPNQPGSNPMGVGLPAAQGQPPAGQSPQAQAGSQALSGSYGQDPNASAGLGGGAPQAGGAGQMPQGMNMPQTPQGPAPQGASGQSPMGAPGQGPQFFGAPSGSRLNYLSQAQPSAMAGQAFNPQTGQRLNIQEGYR